MKFGSVKLIDQKIADQIMSTAKGRKRILRSRSAYTEIKLKDVDLSERKLESWHWVV